MFFYEENGYTIKPGFRPVHEQFLPSGEPCSNKKDNLPSAKHPVSNLIAAIF
jgi:hypothetical protein